MLLNPAIPASARIQVLASLAERAGLAKRVVSFLHTVVDKGRIGQLPAIAREFQQTREKAQGIAAATVSTVAPLPPDLADRVRQSLERLTGQRVRMTCALDPSLIGGVVTRVGSMVYDGSLRTQLLDLRRKMVEE